MRNEKILRRQLYSQRDLIATRNNWKIPRQPDEGFLFPKNRKRQGFLRSCAILKIEYQEELQHIARVSQNRKQIKILIPCMLDCNFIIPKFSYDLAFHETCKHAAFSNEFIKSAALDNAPAV